MRRPLRQRAPVRRRPRPSGTPVPTGPPRRSASRMPPASHTAASVLDDPSQPPSLVGVATLARIRHMLRVLRVVELRRPHRRRHRRIPPGARTRSSSARRSRAVSRRGGRCAPSPARSGGPLRPSAVRSLAVGEPPATAPLRPTNGPGIPPVGRSPVSLPATAACDGSSPRSSPSRGVPSRSRAGLCRPSPTTRLCACRPRPFTAACSSRRGAS